MEIKGWRYYNHAAIPTCAPHEQPDMTPIEDGSVWKLNRGRTFLARWTTDWDCGYETNWWYVIKDKPFDLNSLKSKRRYEVNKGTKYFLVKRINPNDFKNEIFSVTRAAYSSWPEKYRPTVEEKSFISGIAQWNNDDIFGAFSREDNKLCGYAIVQTFDTYAAFSVLRVDPNAENKAINAAMVYGILQEYEKKLETGYYICDGSRSIRHETAFQDYLEKYFMFRKAYCKLNIKYSIVFGIIVKCMYPFRSIINRDTRIGSMISGILKMEEYSR